MSVRLSTIAAIGLTMLCGTSAKDNGVKLASVQGRVHMIDKETSTITVDTKDGKRRLVVYNGDTKVKYGHSNKGKDSSWDQVKETNDISCAGAMDEKMRLIAKECVHRDAK